MNKNSVIARVLFLSTPVFAFTDIELQTVQINANESEATKQSASSGTHISQKVIESMPKGNGNINEIVKFMPDVQAEGNIATSLNAGELEPENLSISGAKFYQNNFQIDGLSNNSLLDPANDNPGRINDVKGHPQEFFLDADMIESIDVYDSDVPAKFGNFLGGVIDAKTKHASPEFSGKLKYRHTSDALTEFHVDDSDEFAYSRSSSEQPKFSKNIYGLSFSLPIGDMDALYVDTSLKTSTIPLMHFDETHNESRNLQNYLAKYSKYFENGDILDLTFSYAPYEEVRFLKNVKDSDYTITGGGVKTIAAYQSEGDVLKLNSTLAYSRTENSREAEANFYNWAVSDTFPWGNTIDSDVSTMGGYGNITKIQELITFKSDIELSQLFDVGLEVQYGNAIMDREEQSAVYKVSSKDGNPQSGIANLKCYGNDGCIEGEQYANSKNQYDVYKAEADIITTAAYVQKDIQFDYLRFRLGGRYDYNNYMQNHDFAYRTLAEYDVLNNKQSVFSVGMNRYYSNSFLTYKLREAQKPYVTYTRALLGGYDTYGNQIVRPGAWEENSRRGSSKTSYGDLQTPYSDETSFGFSQRLFDGMFIIKKIFRENRNDFAQKYSEVQSDGYRYYTLSNDGRSSHESLRISYELGVGNHFLSLNFNRSQTKSTNATYDDAAEEEIDDSIAYYAYYNSAGKKQYRETIIGEISKENETQPDIYKLMYSYSFPKRFTMMSFLTYRTAYKKMVETETRAYSTTNPTTGEMSWEDAPVYELATMGDFFNVDLSLEYKQPLVNNQQLVFRTDITNLLNKKQRASVNVDEYALGRQFWFEMSYIF